MNTRDVLKKLSVDPFSAIPKYLQLADSIVSCVREGSFTKGLLMPSINEVSDELEVSRPTAQRAYKHLQQIKVMDSVPGKCYFITGNTSKSPLQIAIFFNKLSAHKKIIYDAFVKELGKEVSVDLYIYNNDFAFFKNLLEQKGRDYTHYVIIPHFLNNRKEAGKIINRIPKHKLLLLDKKVEGITGAYAAVYEHFEQDIFNALDAAASTINKYKTIKIVFPANSYFPDEILGGFRLFCKKHSYKPVVVTDLLKDVTSKGDLYITLIETDLVTLVERIVNQKIDIGTEVGIISYNETPIKKIILDGIPLSPLTFKRWDNWQPT
jgi:DNA-binding transcriptional regulator YhcF (GntR family)